MLYPSFFQFMIGLMDIHLRPKAKSQCALGMIQDPKKNCTTWSDMLSHRSELFFPTFFPHYSPFWLTEIHFRPSGNIEKINHKRLGLRCCLIGLKWCFHPLSIHFIIVGNMDVHFRPYISSNKHSADSGSCCPFQLENKCCQVSNFLLKAFHRPL